ncbi:MAG TPA: hypothetical protein DCY10_06220 [Clostridiales bacterium]|nr:hypothetical protein [Clostridiales bacterium]
MKERDDRMTMLLTILRLTAFLLSATGYVAVARAYWRITPRASYIFVFSAQALVMYFAGLAGVLVYAAYALFGGGIVLLVALILNKKIKLAYNISSLSAIGLAFVAVFGAITASLIDTFFVHYDNFSHWAVVVKYMLVTDRIPDAASAIIDFKSYPLGSSSFLYYVGRIVGNGEGIMLAGQAILLFASFYAVFGAIRDQKRFLLAALLGLGCSAMAYFNISIRINNLLVDFLLPVLALAVIGVLLVERKRFSTACLACLPVLGLLAIVKNTGIFFALLGYVFLLYRSVQFQRADLKLRPFFWGALGTIVLSLLPLILWNVHTSLAFPVDAGKFSYDFQTLSSFSIDKTPEQIRYIVQLFLYTATSLSQLPTLGFVLFNAIAVVVYLVARFVFHKRWKLLVTLLIMDAAVVLYYGGILAMYILSMPLDEAMRLAGFDRYASSMILFLIGVVSMRLTMDVENSFYQQQGERRDYRAFKSLAAKNTYQAATVVFSIAAGLMLLSELNGMNSSKAAYPETLPARVAAITGDNWHAPDNDTRYLFYSSDKDNEVSSYELPYVGRYFLFVSQVDAVRDFSDETFMGQIQTYDKFVILESTPAIQAYMKKHANLPGEAGIYDVRETFPEAVIPEK